MPRYYFHIREGQSLFHDDEGQELSDVDAARREGISALREIMGEKILHGGSIDSRMVEIADETGHIVDTVSSREVVIPGGRFPNYADDVTQSAPKPKP